MECRMTSDAWGGPPASAMLTIGVSGGGLNISLKMGDAKERKTYERENHDYWCHGWRVGRRLHRGS